jgi:superfamily II DNA or RNA helicase
MNSKDTTTTTYDHWNKRTLEFLKPLLASAKRLVRIATGYFTVQGYDLLSKSLDGKTVFILVGYDEKDSVHQLRQKMIEDIEAHLSGWDTDNRRIAVINLVEKLNLGQFFIAERRENSYEELLNTRIRKNDHAKLYLVDEDLVINGSSNLTTSGLLHNFEGETAVSEPSRVAKWVQWFTDYWEAPDTYDLTQALLEALIRWLRLSLPYDIYLKTIQALVREDDTQVERSSYLMPVQFQQIVIERVMRQLREWRGAFLVASTGLGKTIMATHIAYRLHHRDKRIQNVIVFAPLPTQPEWQKRLRSAGVSYEIFTRNLLDQPFSDKRRMAEVQRILDALDEVDEKYLIIVDESHYFNNRLRAKDGKERFSFERLVEVVNERIPYILLLTATPLAKGIDDLNNQLFLLPHNAPPNHIREDGQIALSAFANLVLDPTAWRIQQAEDYFEKFINLSVCTVISTSAVAKDYAVHTSEGDYIPFGEQKKWIPQIELWKISHPVPLEREITNALNQGYFRHKVQRFQNRGIWQTSESTIEEQLNLSWASSPLALREVIEKTIDGSYNVEFVRSPKERASVLGPLLEQLESENYNYDEKFKALLQCLNIYVKQQQKVIIFTERLATAIYLQDMLLRAEPHLKIANTVRKTATGYEQKDFESEVLPLIYAFAPEANAEKLSQLRHKPPHYDIFISTDAYGMGVNLQDASVVISYDLAWTADVIIQRAGRILRFWKEPRRVFLYAFLGHFRENLNRSDAAKRIEKRLNKLTARTRHAERFSELPILPSEESAEYVSLKGLSNIKIQNLGEIEIGEAEEFSGVSRFLRHISEYQRHADYAANIKDDISSAMTYNGRNHLMYVLMRFKGEFFWAVMDINKQRLLDYKEDDLLELIECTMESPIAAVDADLIEMAAQKTKRMWSEGRNIENPENIQRICALYLKPNNAPDALDEMLIHSQNSGAKGET